MDSPPLPVPVGSPPCRVEWGGGSRCYVDRGLSEMCDNGTGLYKLDAPMQPGALTRPGHNLQGTHKRLPTCSLTPVSHPCVTLTWIMKFLMLRWNFTPS
jgi:hypothetical protein